ncbi:hypothetical protein OSB04_027915 [Centaurea solstitialis]|uniref:Uncharacterized protein n=1 Tax=Centaurea solstitialis TaxID=347529 RepID=A0AA38SEI4_9ASTR|nr:hypothetical protein OSB04_027915 [Centaurea solstitialis]
MHAPTEAHWNAIKPIIRYLQGTSDYGLHLSPAPNLSLLAYTDADWAGCPDTRRSTSGYCVYLGDNLLSWSSKRQPTVSRSSAEAEYRGVANVVAEICWLRNLLLELNRPLSRATLVYCDNVSAIYLSGNPVQHQRTKHIELDIHFVREHVQWGCVRVLHVPSRFQVADIFTKGLSRVLFDDFRSSLNIRPPNLSTAGVHHYRSHRQPRLPPLLLHNLFHNHRRPLSSIAIFTTTTQRPLLTPQSPPLPQPPLFPPLQPLVTTNHHCPSLLSPLLATFTTIVGHRPPPLIAATTTTVGTSHIP